MNSTTPFSQLPSAHWLGTLLFLFCAFWACDLPKVEGPNIVDDAPIARFSATPTSGPAPLTVTITNLSENALSSAWTFGDGQNASTTSPGTHIYNSNSASPYALRLVVTGTNGRTDDTTIFISVMPIGTAPQADFTFTNDGCNASCPIAFTSTSTNALSQTWNFGDPASGAANTSTIAAPSHTYNTAGTYNVKLKVQNGAVLDSITKVVTIGAPAAAVTWIKTFDLGAGSGFEFVKGIDQLANGEIYFASNDYKSVYLGKLTAQGTLIGSPTPVSLGTAYDAIFTRYFQKTGSGYYLGGYCHYVGGVPSDDFYGLALNADFSLRMQGDLYDTDDGNEIGHGITRTDDGGYMLCGNKTTGSNTGMLFIKTNSNFVVESRKNIQTGDPTNSAIVVRNTADGFAVIGKTINPSTAVSEGCFFRTDDNLNIVGNIKYLGAFNPEDIIDNGDGSYCILGDGASGGRIIRIGSSNTVFWDKEYGRLMRRGVKTADGNIAVVGSILNGTFSIALYKINIETGNLIWERSTYATEGSTTQGLFMMQSADNGFLLGGLDFLNSAYRSLIIKTDEMGNVN